MSGGDDVSTTPVVEDAYAEYIQRRREQAAATPEPELFSIELSASAVVTLGSMLEVVKPKNEEARRDLDEIAAAVQRAVREAVRATDPRPSPGSGLPR